jgi:hypothetical protein
VVEFHKKGRFGMLGFLRSLAIPEISTALKF